MRKVLNRRNAGKYSYLIVLAMLGSLWWGTEAIKESMENEEIYKLPSVRSTISASDVKDLRAVSEMSPAAKKQEREQSLAQRVAGQGDVDVNAVFGEKKEEIAPPPQPKFEFDKFFKENASLNAVMSNGAVINGHFFELGSDMELLAVVGEQGHKVVPVLRSVSDTTAVVGLGKINVQLSLRSIGAM